MRTLTSFVCLTVAVLAAGCGQPTPPPEEQMHDATGLENGSFTASLNGFDIHYEVHGQGPVVMTIPNSWGLELSGLRALYRPLEQHVTMVYFDPRGMGESAPVREEADMGLTAVRADLDALREHLGLDTVTAIGWSNGASNLIYLAAEHPDTITKAIFVHGVASIGPEDMQALAARYPDLIKRWMAMQAELADDTLPTQDKTARMKTMWLDEWFTRMLADPDANRDKVRKAFADVQFSWPHADYSNREQPVFDARDRLPSITARCLVIAGAHDMSPVAKSEELHAGLANSELVVLEDSGHFAPIEQPEAFQRTMLEFLGVSAG